MTTFTIKINEQTKAGKAFRTMMETFFKGIKGIEIIENSSEEKESFYDPEFVKMIKEREKKLGDRNNLTTLDPKDIWGSIL